MESDQISKLRSGIETTLRSGMDMVQKRLSSGSSTSKTASVLAKRATNTTVDMSKQCGITENGGISVKANGCCPALTMRGGDRTVDQCPWHCAFAEETGPAGSDTASCSCKHCCGDPAVVDDECATVSGCATAIGRAANDTSGLKIVDRGAACKQCVGGDKYCHTNGCEGLIVLPSTDNGFVRGQYEQCVSSDASIRTGSISVWIASSLALLCSLYIF
ncbi:unnamed protein product [Amoebophrya sp. A25]|nr:unnamed protein product [Amoebophrya sp. A25]|eukprot:GSA25T00000569001.1